MTRAIQVTAALGRRGLTLDDPMPWGTGPEIAAELGITLPHVHIALEAARLRHARNRDRAAEVGFTGERCQGADCHRGATKRIGRCHYCRRCAANFVRFYCGGGK